MGRIVLGVLVVLVLGVVAFFVWSQQAEIAARATARPPSFDKTTIDAGAELAMVGNCDACHTAAPGADYAGGVPVPTPFGTIYSSNITPDPATGIGRWPEAAFRRALRDGIARDGSPLYPAFPYDHYTKLTDADIHALYAFLMTRAPIRRTTPANRLIFPLNFRWTVAAWNLLNLDRTPIQANPQEGPVWNRGAYLVAALGHCGSCHTPRNWLAAEERTEAFTGGVAESWYAPALTAASPAPVPWTTDELVAYLQHGAVPTHGAAAGPMAPVTRDLARASAADVQAIATYVASLQRNMPTARSEQAASRLASAARPAAQPVSYQASDLGATLFAGACAACHAGGPLLQPPRGIDLSLSSVLNEPKPTDAIHILLDGIGPPAGQRGPWMPHFRGALTDQQITALLGYLRTQIAHQAAWPELDESVHDIRQRKSPS